MKSNARRQRCVDPSIYTMHYYLHDCCGADEFAVQPGKLHPHVAALLKNLTLRKGMKILDVGCGRGDVVLYCAKKGLHAIGVDYSRAAITIARKSQASLPPSLRKRITFKQSDAKKLPGPADTYDLITCFDVFEHLYPEELDIVVEEMYRVLKPNGVLLVHTEPNRWYLNFTHHVYIYPVSQLLIGINRLFTGKEYPGIPRDPRNQYHKEQHVNEPTVFYLRSLFAHHGFEGKVNQQVSLLKPHLSWKDRLYNHVVLLYPFCLFPPLIYLFAYDYVCLMRKTHKADRGRELA